jgi:hypothetical protein
LIPKNVEILGLKCFLFCQSLLSIAFESNSKLTPSLSLKALPEEAFSFSGLMSIVIPATVRIVEKRAFYHCRSLTKLQWAEGSRIKVTEEEGFNENISPDKVAVGLN